MRASSRESPGCCGFVLAVERVEQRQAVALALRRDERGDFRREQIGDRIGHVRPDDRALMARPAETRRRSCPALLYGSPRRSGSTTNVGRLSLRLPRP